MIAILLSTLFAASAVLAIATIGASWRRYGATALAIRSQLRSCADMRDVRFTIHAPPPRITDAVVVRAEFGRRVQPVTGSGWRAAA